MSDYPIKHILVVYYSQSGQLKTISDNFMLPFRESGCDIEMVEIKPKKAYTFPWTGKSFFDVMPESVLCIKGELEEPNFKRSNYDLVVFAYQPWFLSPSIPASTLLQNEKFKAILQNTPVVTLIGARNMWISANEKIKKLLAAAKANLVGNIVLTDKNPNLISAITIQYWMFTGKKEKLFGIFPKPGVSEKDINLAHVFGSQVLKCLNQNNLSHLQNELINKKALSVNHVLMFVESRAIKIFHIWANIIINKNNRSAWLLMFKYYLIIALFILSPVVILIYITLIYPFTTASIKNRLKYYQSVNYEPQR